MPLRNFKQLENYLRRLANFELRPGNKSSYFKKRFKIFKDFINILDNPQDRYKTFHIAGTKGKGSTGAALASILRHAGYKVGFYTSPHLVDFRERIRINNSVISRKDLLAVSNKIISASGPVQLTYFEFLTAAAFLHYLLKKVDFAVIETGLGGRLDATNVISKPYASIIALIGYDHTQYLGTTLGSIAKEKAPIIKKNSPAITTLQQNTVMKVIKEYCAKKSSKLHIADNFKILELELGRTSFRFEGKNYISNMSGGHQVSNLAMAIKASKLAGIGGTYIQRGLKNVDWKGRLQVIRKNPYIILDGAHNIDSAKILTEALKKLFPKKKVIFIISVMKDKDAQSMISEFAKVSDTIIISKLNMNREYNPKKLSGLCEKFFNNIFIAANVKSALKMGIRIAGKAGVVCASGSLYLVGKILREKL